MNIHEYQAKGVLAEFGVPVPKGTPAFTVEEAVGYALEAIDAVAQAHKAGIVHRDLKPANLFLAKRPDGSHRIKVLDFGISKSLSDSSLTSMRLTSTTTLIGSPLTCAVSLRVAFVFLCAFVVRDTADHTQVRPTYASRWLCARVC